MMPGASGQGYDGPREIASLFPFPAACPIASPWHADGHAWDQLNAGNSIKPDDFMPPEFRTFLDMEVPGPAPLHIQTLSSLTTIDSEQSSFAEGFQVPEHSYSCQQTVPVMGCPILQPSLPSHVAVASGQLNGGETVQQKKKVILPASTRKTNREAQQRFRLKQKQRQQEMTEEVEKLRRENEVLKKRIKRLESLLKSRREGRNEIPDD